MTCGSRNVAEDFLYAPVRYLGPIGICRKQGIRGESRMKKVARKIHCKTNPS